ncbi:MAG: hypothetical protein KatS3mg034_2074 [Vicingaceae bacterium]|nr:MAG: hypothetical protein KatS3mg034_2074 [Vicingaceae bacterium]
MKRILVSCYYLIVPLFNRFFPGSDVYWEKRYKRGKTSGSGSYNRLAYFKASVINDFVTQKNIKTILELGCGDGEQLKLYNFPQYIGLDVSMKAIEICKEKFKEDPTKQFFLFEKNFIQENFNRLESEMTLSADVIYHLIEDEIYEEYMRLLFDLSRQWVVIYSSNFEGKQLFHERDRCFTEWVEKKRQDFKLIMHIPNRYPYDPNFPDLTSKSDFYIYKKIPGA